MEHRHRDERRPERSDDADDVASTRRDLIYALTDELSDALAEREQVAETHPARAKADAVVTGLTAAINTEVRRNRI